MSKCLLLIILLQCGACSAPREWRYLPRSIDDQHSIYVVSHGWHTGLILKANDVAQPLNFIQSALGAAEFYEFGWGDKGFYQAEQINLSLVLQAIFWSSASVVHVVSFNADPSVYFPTSKVLELKLSAEGLTRLVNFVAQTFKRGDSGTEITIGPGIYGHSLFFASEQAYNLMHTCNTWVAEALAQAGAPMTTGKTITATGVMVQVKNAAREYQCCEQ